ncbi:MAG: hypothetical protein ACJA1I_001320 [Zhongshania marina]|jgi:hypothetical protein|uniref:Uncharacterized protein n=1 Tax=Zhongshania marina TaxID=2304603 RepID=A0A2S4HJQ1_9GAMM|nr:hypothetical protein [Marortus luteolus]POP54215.1 hypothetical protein C0068_02810 [Marortus luteolus]RNL60968.1 hypothetical protein D0911_13300 [Zhongshania marina]
MTAQKVVSLSEYRQDTQQMHIDDVSAQAFLFLQEQAQELDLPMRKLLKEHLLGIACVVKAVEGLDEAQNWLALISDEINTGEHH